MSRPLPQALGFPAAEAHSRMSAQARAAAVRDLREGPRGLLVGTDPLGGSLAGAGGHGGAGAGAQLTLVVWVSQASSRGG